MPQYDLFLFMGQSNMAGRGIVSARWPQQAPALLPGAGWEFRAISDPTALYPIREPFGVNENNPKGIYEPGMKTGSMVTSFVNSYYARTNIPVLGISASKGGSVISQWQGNDDYLTDSLERLKRAEAFCQRNEITLRRRFVLWCQGESDGDRHTACSEYKAHFSRMLSLLLSWGIQHLFLITIGQYNGSAPVDYREIIRAQHELACELPQVTLVCDAFERMKERGMMKDEFHYFQAAYNEAGALAGAAAAEFSIQETDTFKHTLPQEGF